MRTRPTFSERISPLLSSTCRCWTTLGSDIGSGRGELADRCRTAAETLDDHASARVREGVEHLVQIVRHMLKYCHGRPAVKGS